jgi:hypothetical protein
MRINSSGHVGINCTPDPVSLHVNGHILCGPDTAYGGTTFPLTVAFTGSSHQGAVWADNATDTAARYAIYFKRRANSSWATVGSITTAASSTAYNTSSDYRMKENVIPMSGSIDRLKELKPSRFNFIKDPNKTVDGFLAHEAQEVVPEAITGEKDAMTEPVLYTEEDELPEGKSIGDVKTASVPDMQGIDQGKLVPLLVGALQEAITKIATLETTVTTLEAVESDSSSSNAALEARIIALEAA